MYEILTNSSRIGQGRANPLTCRRLRHYPTSAIRCSRNSRSTAFVASFSACR
jgi:hypothetical protein